MARVSSRRSDLARALADSGSPIYVLDVGRRVVGCNPATLSWLEYEGDDVIGQRCDYHSTADEGASRVAQVAASLCPPPEVFAGERRRACLGVTTTHGRLKWRWAEFVPLDLDGEGGAVMAVLDSEDGDPSIDSRTDERGSSRAHEQGLHQRLLQLRHATAERFSLDRLVGVSPWIERARAQAVMAVRGGESVLIVGPTGSGKEHLAKAIHYGRARGAEPSPAAATLAVVSGADADLELFQSVVAPLMSRPMGADGTAPATLLVLDADQLAAEVQAELQRLISKGLLGAAPIATATRPLVELAPAGRFRFDLACSLGTIVIELPALAKRSEDVPLLAQALLESANARGGKQVSGFTSEALDWLAMHEWLGNVDELAEAIEAAHGNAADSHVTLADLPRTIHLAADAARHPRRADEPIELNTFLRQVERELITRALERAKGNKSKAARLLGLTRPRLYRRMVQLGLE